MGKLYVDEVGILIELETGADLTDVTSQEILYKKPDGTSSSWSASIVDSTLQYTTVADDLDQDGDWILQAHIVGTGFDLVGETVVMQVYKRWR